MEGLNVKMRTLFVFCLVLFSLLPGNWVAAEETTAAAPDVRQIPVTPDQAPIPRAPQPDVIPQHTLTIGKTGNGHGKVTTSPPGALFKKGTQVTIQAVPEENSVFTGWSGGCSVSSPKCTVSMTADRIVTASFTLKTYTIHVPSPVNGVVHPSGMIKAAHGEKRRFQVIPLPGFRIYEVLVDKVSVGAVNSYTFDTVTRDHVLEAIFVKK